MRTRYTIFTSVTSVATDGSSPSSDEEFISKILKFI